MLGVIIGVASVIVMVSVASGAGQAIEARIKSLGTNLLVIRRAPTPPADGAPAKAPPPRCRRPISTCMRERVPGVVAAVAGLVQRIGRRHLSATATGPHRSTA